MTNKYDYEANWRKAAKRSWDGWDKKQSAWRQAEGVCKVCKEEYIRYRRLSRSSDTEYDHGSWVCMDKYIPAESIGDFCRRMIGEYEQQNT